MFYRSFLGKLLPTILLWGMFSVQASFAASPQITNVVLNNSQNISLIENTTTSVQWTAAVTDNDGITDINSISGTLYRAGVAGGPNCTPDNHNCYHLVSETLRSCRSFTCSVTFVANVDYYADPTDEKSAYASQFWMASVTAVDNSNNSSIGLSPLDSTELLSLSAVSVDSSLVISSPVLPGSNTGSSGLQVIIKNSGNVGINNSYQGDDLCLDYPACTGQKITVGNIHIGSSTDFSLGTPLTYTPINWGWLDTQANASKYIGIAIPLGEPAGNYHTQITFASSQAVLRPLGAVCSQDSDCAQGSCLGFHRDADGDGLGASSVVKFCSESTPPWGYITDSTDLDDSQYCPNTSYNPGTCQKCNSGAVVLQTASEDIFAQCNSSPSGCQSDLCSGTTAACAYTPNTTVCRPAAGVCDIAESCTGSNYDCPADGFQNTGHNPGTTCQKCTGSSADPVNQTAAEDMFNQCTAAYTGCSGACVKTGPNGLCDGSGSCSLTGLSTNIADGSVCTSGNEISPTSTNYCNTTSNCTAGSCNGTTYYRACNGSGSCRTDNTFAASAPIYAASGQSFDASCNSNTNQSCRSTCIGCDASCDPPEQCNGSGSCLADSIAPQYSNPNNWGSCSGSYHCNANRKCVGDCFSQVNNYFCDGSCNQREGIEFDQGYYYDQLNCGGTGYGCGLVSRGAGTSSGCVKGLKCAAVGTLYVNVCSFKFNGCGGAVSQTCYNSAGCPNNRNTLMECSYYFE